LLGLIAFGLILLHWFVWMARGWRAPPRDESDRDLLICVAATLAGLPDAFGARELLSGPLCAVVLAVLAVTLLMASALVGRGDLEDMGKAEEEE